MNEGADVNKCVASVSARLYEGVFLCVNTGSSHIQDCTSPLFLAVSANEYKTTLELIKKGAAVDAIRVSKLLNIAQTVTTRTKLCVHDIHT